MFWHVFFIFPETAGKTLEETEAMFEDPNGIPYLGTPAWKTTMATQITSRAERGDVESKLAHHEQEHHEKTSASPPAEPTA